MFSKIFVVMVNLLFTSILYNVSGEYMTYYLVSVDETILTNAVVNETVKSVSLVTCAHLANREGWCHLYCHYNHLFPSSCTLYDLQIPATYKPKEGKTTVTCYTDMKEGRFPCIDPFEYAEGLDCVTLVAKNYNFTKARDNCLSINGTNLVIPQEFSHLLYFVAEFEESGTYWVGIYNGIWMNGQQTLPEEWTSGSEGSEYPCAKILNWSTTLLKATNCSKYNWSICQKII